MAEARQKNPGDERQEGGKESRLTIPRRVFLGFALILTMAGLGSVASIVQHQRTAATLGLLREGYLPLSLMVSEGRATQSVLGNLLERMMSERNTSATRAWLNAGRRGRPRMLTQALASVARIEALAPPPPERETLARVRRDLMRVQTSLRKADELYDALYAALDAGERERAEGVLEELRSRERSIDGRLRSAWNTILARIEATSAAAAEQQQQFTAILIGFAVVTLIVGILVTVWSQRMLSPLPRLQRRVAAVAEGDLALQLGPKRDDEIGRLAAEFERMVAALAARDQRLREATENQLRMQQMQAEILAELSAAVVVVDEQGGLLTRNPAAERLLALDKQVVGQLLSQTDLSERLPRLLGMVSRVSSSGTPETALEERMDGAPEKLLNIHVTPFGAGGEGLPRKQVLVVVEDVTEAVHTKSRLIQSERLAAIGRMAAHVTHEVRNPLSSIGLNMEMLEEELASAGDEARVLVAAIQREIERLRVLTEEYLRVARLPAPELTPERVDEVIRSATDFMARELTGSGIQVDLDLPADLPLVSLDEGQVRQVLLNLLKNAREAMPEGGRLQVSAGPVAGGVEVSVSDSGVGMDEEQRARIFDLFYTTKKLGTGLGLPLTQQIVLAHGGNIRCVENPGGGTRFALWFPAASAEGA